MSMNIRVTFVNIMLTSLLMNEFDVMLINNTVSAFTYGKLMEGVITK